MNIDFNRVASSEWNWSIGEGSQRFDITVRAHHKNYSPEALAIIGDEGQWGWCIYAIFPEAHSFYLDPSAALKLDWHGGVTYDKIFTERYTDEKYDWQKSHSYRKIGCDYQHYRDDHFARMGPSEGVPYEIQQDVLLLIRQIEEYKS